MLGALVDEKLRDREQQRVVGDLVEFLRHPDAQVVSFDNMGPTGLEYSKRHARRGCPHGMRLSSTGAVAGIASAISMGATA